MTHWIFKSEWDRADILAAVICLLFTVWFASGLWFRMAPVVKDMTASGWCAGPGFVQADIAGRKVRPWYPRPGSITGYADGRDVAFEVVGDPSPASAKPVGIAEFGLWRWYAQHPSSVDVTLIHELGSAAKLTEIGPFILPETLPECEE